MIETERQLSKKTSIKPDVLYEEQFYGNIFFCCFTEKKLVVIKKRTLFIYKGAEQYLEKPDEPYLFFDLNQTHCTLYESTVKISNSFASLTLQHPKTVKLLNLLQAINKARHSLNAEDVYHKKFVYFESAELDQLNNF